ncbi:hypothetical protein UI24_08220 [Mycobacteroides franklinii]|nr:hypothetical protein [Mycobacteroides franklinii]
MTVIDEFIEQYVKVFDFYEQLARIVEKTLENDLREAGIRCIVTSRAKAIEALKHKCIRRHKEKPFSSTDDVYHAIADLAGVRVALYFPDDKNRVHTSVSKLFDVIEEPISFPQRPENRPGRPRFDGYSATHYRVKVRESSLSGTDKRYATAKVEIQVASVLMHAWSEVEHDLVYKPREGDLSDDEYAVLDQLNGLVMAGEIALESLRRAASRRVSGDDRKFMNHYELAAFLLGLPSVVSEKPLTDQGLGRVDRLFALLQSLKIDTPRTLDKYLVDLHDNYEVRPLADQVIDSLLAEDSNRYRRYREVKRNESIAPSASDGIDTQIGRFLKSWISLEKIERDLGAGDVAGPGTRLIRTGRELLRLGFVDEATFREIDQLRRLRNAILHGGELPPSGLLVEAAERVDEIVRLIQRGGVVGR